jgi:hypothetical protein
MNLDPLNLRYVEYEYIIAKRYVGIYIFITHTTLGKIYLIVYIIYYGVTEYNTDY